MVTKINDGITDMGCPAGCKATTKTKRGKLTHEDFKKVLSKEDFVKWETRKALKEDKNLEFCWTADCEGAFNIEPNDKTYECPICQKTYCLLCKNKAHPDMTCQ